MRVEMIAHALDLVYPPRCGLCGRIGEPPACPECVADMHSNGPPAAPVPLVDRCWIRFDYSARAAQAVRRLKFDRVTSLGPVLGQFLLAEIRGVLGDFDAVVPVPIHAMRWIERGFNQAESLTKGWPCRVDLSVLRRIKRTRPQVGLSQAERLANLQGAFSARNVKGSRILLVDDVITSGATMTACADALRKAGARVVSAAALCGEKLGA